MRIHKCWYCSANIYPGRGLMFVRNDSKNFKFCSGKCHKHFQKRKTPKKSSWTKTGRAYRKKDLSINDPIYQFEKHRNVPVKYDRDLMVQTVQGMLRIKEIKAAREARYSERRIRVLHKENAHKLAWLKDKHSVLVNGPKVPEHKDLSRIVAKRINQIKTKKSMKEAENRKQLLHKEEIRTRVSLTRNCK